LQEGNAMERYGTSLGGGPVLNRSPSSKPVPKVQAASIGGGIGGAVAILVIGMLRRAGIELSVEEVGAATILITAFCSGMGAFLAGYITPPQGFGRNDDDHDGGGTTDVRSSGGGELGGPQGFKSTDSLRRAGLAILLLMGMPALTSCTALNPALSLVGVQAVPMRDARDHLLVLESRHEANLRTIDELERRGFFTNQRDRNMLADLIEQSGRALDEAQTAVRTGKANQQSLLSIADRALFEVTLWLRQRQERRTA
jgi:hypothetical protein